MKSLRVKIEEYVDDHQPGWVRCSFEDADKNIWYIVEKVPIVTAQYFDSTSNYPQPGTIACEIVGQKSDSNGREILTINIEKPWGVETEDGKTIFDVYKEEIIDE